MILIIIINWIQMRNSRQKDIIIEALCEYDIHPTADELYKFICKKHPDIGVATVYRNLNKFALSGKINKIIGVDGLARFDYNTEPHFHFSCNCCGRIHDITKEIAPTLIKEAEKVSNCKIFSLEITFKGLCKECQEHGSNKNLTKMTEGGENLTKS